MKTLCEEILEILEAAEADLAKEGLTTLEIMDRLEIRSQANEPRRPPAAHLRVIK
jgi:hypothetical protein